MEQSQNPPQALVSELAGDPDLAELVVTFAHELPERAKAIEQALRSADLERLTTLAHQLKGAAGSYGFPAITNAAAAVVKAVRSGRPLEQLAAEVNECVAMCRCARASA